MDGPEAILAAQRATVSVDRRGIIHKWGDAVSEVVGYSADQTIGRNLNVVIPPVLRPLHWWGFDRAMKSGRMDRSTMKVPALRQDGRIVVAHAIVELVPGSAGDADGAVVTFTGVGPPWQGIAWRVALAPLNVVRGVWQRTRASRRRRT